MNAIRMNLFREGFKQKQCVSVCLRVKLEFLVSSIRVLELVNLSWMWLFMIISGIGAFSNPSHAKIMTRSDVDNILCLILIKNYKFSLFSSIKIELSSLFFATRHDHWTLDDAKRKEKPSNRFADDKNNEFIV